VVVLNLDKADPSVALTLAAELHRAGIRAEAYMGEAGMKAQMKYADRRRAPIVVMAGGDEIAKGTVTLKDLEAGAKAASGIGSHEDYREARPGQIEAPRAEMIAAIRKMLGARA
jgi:histidyl-tRNA synthetase